MNRIINAYGSKKNGKLHLKGNGSDQKEIYLAFTAHVFFTLNVNTE